MYINGLNTEIWWTEIADESFLEYNKPGLREYVKFRIRGYSREEAFAWTFGRSLEYRLHEAIDAARAIEKTCLCRKIWRATLEDIQPEKLWNIKEAMLVLSQIANDPDNSNATRLESAKELDLLRGYTEQNGNRVLGDQSTGDVLAKKIALRLTPEMQKRIDALTDQARRDVAEFAKEQKRQR